MAEIHIDAHPPARAPGDHTPQGTLIEASASNPVDVVSLDADLLVSPAEGGPGSPLFANRPVTIAVPIRLTSATGQAATVRVEPRAA